MYVCMCMYIIYIYTYIAYTHTHTHTHTDTHTHTHTFTYISIPSTQSKHNLTHLYSVSYNAAAAAGRDARRPHAGAAYTTPTHFIQPRRRSKRRRRRRRCWWCWWCWWWGGGWVWGGGGGGQVHGTAGNMHAVAHHQAHAPPGVSTELKLLN